MSFLPHDCVLLLSYIVDEEEEPKLDANTPIGIHDTRTQHSYLTDASAVSYNKDTNRFVINDDIIRPFYDSNVAYNTKSNTFKNRTNATNTCYEKGDLDSGKQVVTAKSHKMTKRVTLRIVPHQNRTRHNVEHHDNIDATQHQSNNHLFIESLSDNTVDIAQSEDYQLARYQLRDKVNGCYLLIVDIINTSIFEQNHLLDARVKFSWRRGDSDQHIQGFVEQIDRQVDGNNNQLLRLHIRPQLYKLQKEVTNRTFYKKSVQDILSGALNSYTSTLGNRIEFDLKSTYPQHEVCLQLQQSTYDFILRITQQEGISFYVTNQNNNEVIVFFDQNKNSINNTSPSIHDIWDIPFSLENPLGYSHIHQLSVNSTQPFDLSVQHPYEWQSAPETNLSESKNSNSKKIKSNLLQPLSPLLDKQQQNRYARIHEERQQYIHSDKINARSNIAGLKPGTIFKLVHHPIMSMNQEYMILDIEHTGQIRDELSTSQELNNQFIYTNQFSCIPAQIPYRPHISVPPNPTRTLFSATVVGAKLEEVHADAYGRVQIVFPWDKYKIPTNENKNEESTTVHAEKLILKQTAHGAISAATCDLDAWEGYESLKSGPQTSSEKSRTGAESFPNAVWVRINQLFAGHQSSFTTYPRVGSEVMVGFLHNHVDFPVIVGSLNNNMNLPIYDPQSHATRTTLRSMSIPYNMGYNEICLESACGKESIEIHAQKDYVRRIRGKDIKWVVGNALGESGRPTGMLSSEDKEDIETQLLLDFTRRRVLSFGKQHFKKIAKEKLKLHNIGIIKKATEIFNSGCEHLKKVGLSDTYDPDVEKLLKAYGDGPTSNSVKRKSKKRFIQSSIVALRKRIISSKIIKIVQMKYWNSVRAVAGHTLDLCTGNRFTMSMSDYSHFIVGDLSERVAADALRSIGGDYKKSIVGDEVTECSGGYLRLVQDNHIVRTSRKMEMFSKKGTSIITKGNKYIKSKNLAIQTDEEFRHMIGKDLKIRVRENKSEIIKGTSSTKSDEIHIEAKKKIVIKQGSSSITISSSGICIKAQNIQISSKDTTISAKSTVRLKGKSLYLN